MLRYFLNRKPCSTLFLVGMFLLSSAFAIEAACMTPLVKGMGIGFIVVGMANGIWGTNKDGDKHG